MVHLYSGPSSSGKVEEALSVQKWKDSQDKLFSEKMKVYRGGYYMETIPEHTNCLLCYEFFTLTPFSVSVHCHQWRKWLWEDGKCPPDCSAFDFLGKGIDHLFYVL